MKVSVFHFFLWTCFKMKVWCNKHTPCFYVFLGNYVNFLWYCRWRFLGGEVLVDTQYILAWINRPLLLWFWLFLSQKCFICIWICLSRYHRHIHVQEARVTKMGNWYLLKWNWFMLYITVVVSCFPDGLKRIDWGSLQHRGIFYVFLSV